MLQEFLKQPYSIYIIVYSLLFIIGLFFGFSLPGMIILVVGAVASVLAIIYLKNTTIPIFITAILPIIAFYYFIKREV